MAAVPGPSVGGLRGAVDLSPLVARAVAPTPPARPPAAPAAGVPTRGSDAPPEGAAPSLPLVQTVGDADFSRVVELSSTVPVIVALVATWSTPSAELVPVLTRIVQSFAGRMVLAVVDTDASPQLAAAFKAESIPTVAAVIAGQPVSLFAGSPPEEQLRPLFDQVLELAAQHGVTGILDAGAEPGAAAPAAPVEPPLPPLHAQAYEAIDNQDYAEAARLFRTAIAQDPRDSAAVAALAQVELLRRLSSVVPAEVREAAAADPKDADAALAVADLDLSGGHVDDAFDRLLSLFATLPSADRTPVRTRLLDYFEIIGPDDPRVGAARRRLTTLLY